jgi:hypothetical protein
MGAKIGLCSNALHETTKHPMPADVPKKYQICIQTPLTYEILTLPVAPRFLYAL